MLLKRLGVAAAFYRAGHETCPGYASVWGRSDVGYNDAIVNPMGPSWRLDRSRFDAMLAEKAVELGTKLVWSTRFVSASKGKAGDPGLINVNYFCRSTTTILAGLGLGNVPAAIARAGVVVVQD
ncbi:MAG: hypothetical protein JKY37_18900 [Nannocystaceae bacterium]|nr:hypothetical protein [Nannocystaceae bacterium]